MIPITLDPSIRGLRHDPDFIKKVKHAIHSQTYQDTKRFSYQHRRFRARYRMVNGHSEYHVWPEVAPEMVEVNA